MPRFVLACALFAVFVLGVALAFADPAAPPPAETEVARLEVLDVRDLDESVVAAVEVPGAKIAIGPDGGTLIVLGTAEVIEKVRAELARIRGEAASSEKVGVQTALRILSVPEDGPPRYIASPHLTMVSGQKAEMTTGDEIELTITPKATDRAIEMAVEFRLTRKAARADGAAESREVAYRTTVELADGGSTLLDAGRDPSGARLLLELTARTVALDFEAVEPDLQEIRPKTPR